MQFQLLTNLILFILLSIFLFTIPGYSLLFKAGYRYNWYHTLILGTTIGLVFFSVIGYLLLYLHLPIFIFPILIVLNLLSVNEFLRLKSRSIFFSTSEKKRFIPALKRAGFSLTENKISSTFKQLKIHLTHHMMILFIVLLIGVIGQLMVISPSGWSDGGKVVFWSSHGHDGSWHIALMNEINNNFPLQNPVFAGERLVNYHFFSDIAPAFFTKYFKLSALDLYFRFFPLLFSILLGATSFILGKAIGKTFSSGLWSMIFTYFAGSFGYIATFLKDRYLGGESIFWSSQIQSSIGNPPQIISSILIISILIVFSTYLESKNWKIGLLIILLTGPLIVFKVYAGVLILAGLGLVALWRLLAEHSWDFLLIFLSSAILASILYFPNSSSSTAFLIWQPWWYIRTMVVADNRLNWLDLELRRQTYLSEQNYKRVAELEIIAFLIFFVGNLGMRIFGLWKTFQDLTKITKNYLSLLIIVIIFIAFIIPLLFLQKGVASNSIQFFQYFLLLMGIYAGVTVSQLIDRIKLLGIKFTVAILIIILAVPTQLGLLYQFYHRPPFAQISESELAALNFLKTDTDDHSLILTPPFNQFFIEKQPTPDIWAWSDTSYVAAFSNRPVFLADTEQVDIMGYDWRGREQIQKQIFTETDPQALNILLSHNNINYLYFPVPVKPAADLTKTSLTQVFSNDSIQIWKIN